MSSSASIANINSSSTIDLSFDTYLIDASSNPITVTLTTIVGDGMQLLLRRTDTNILNTVNIVGESGEPIDSKSSIIIKPNSSIKINAFNNAWYTVNGNPNGNEINIAFNQLVGTQTTRPYVLVNNPAFTSLGFFKYRGSDYYGVNPIKLEITYSIDSSISVPTDFTVQLQDITNIKIISTLGPISQSGTYNTILTASTTFFSDIPGSESIIEVNGKINSGANIRLHGVNLILN